MKQKAYNAFTLIELLVVIAIIGLLAAVVLVSLSSSKVKSRDAKRLADIKQLMTAIELYYDANGAYPVSGGALSPNNGWSNSNDASWASLLTRLSPYTQKLPTDPKQDPSGWPASGNYSYAYYSALVQCSSQGYMLVYKLETASGPDSGVTICPNFFQYGGVGANTQIKTVGASKY